MAQGPCGPKGQLCSPSQRGPGRLLVLVTTNPCTGCKLRHGRGSLPGSLQPPRQGAFTQPSPGVRVLGALSGVMLAVVVADQERWEKGREERFSC